MMIIYKYPLEVKDVQVIEMPGLYVILSVQVQGDTICLWAVVNPEMSSQPVTIEIIGTGCSMDTGKYRKHLGTVQLGRFVWNVFQLQGTI